ncbi:MAG: hypothetical protein IV085_03990 [Thiobacillus sp.]|nr:hypothetical protein [Thiobacillus sp.]
MRSPFKRFLLFLMLLVLPLQGFASAAMLGCAFSHPAQTLQHAFDMQAMTDDSGATCHESEPTGKVSPSKACSHCAACYLASALLVPAIDIVTIVPATHRIVSLADDAFTGHIPDSPERPPRPYFA